MVPILSLIVAAAAVVVSPLISWLVSKRQLRSFRRQIEASVAVANMQIVAPMRQAWINNLRDLVAELSSSTLHYYQTGFEDRGESDYQRLTFLEQKIKLMLNPNEADHQQLEWMIREVMEALEKGRDGDHDFMLTHPEVVNFSRQVFKREWNRVKEGPPHSDRSPDKNGKPIRVSLIVLAIVLMMAVGWRVFVWQKTYRVVERTDRYLNKQGHPVAEGFEDPSYDHDEIVLILEHGVRRIHATCDLSTVDKLDPSARCSLHPLKNYECEAGRSGWTVPLPQSDLICKDSDGHPVYLYVSKED